MTDPMVGAGAQQGERHAEIALQRGEEFDEAMLPAHLTQIPAGIGLPEFRDLTFEARPIAGLPPCFDRALIAVVPCTSGSVGASCGTQACARDFAMPRG